MKESTFRGYYADSIKVLDFVEDLIDEVKLANTTIEKLLANGFLDLKQKHKNLYIAVNEMMAPLGAHGQISAKDDRVSAVMDALHDIDGGAYDTDKVFNT